MAQSRPPPIRHASAVPTSPPFSEKPSRLHHTRRKSGKDNVVVVSEKKPGKPALLSRRTTPQYYVTKVGPAGWSGEKERERGRDWEEEDRGRDSGESFPQFCMTCEKEFLPANSTFLYCSEACRQCDNTFPNRSNSHLTTSRGAGSPPSTPYLRHLSYPYSTDDGPDIVPRASPSQSRPRSYFFNSETSATNGTPYTQSSSTYYQQPSSTQPDSSSPTQSSSNIYTNSRSSTALASLRELATALPRISSHNSSSTARNSLPRSTPPPKSSRNNTTTSGVPTLSSSSSRPTSGVWNYISVPFTSSSSSGSKTAASPTANTYFATTATGSGTGTAGDYTTVSSSYEGCYEGDRNASVSASSSSAAYYTRPSSYYYGGSGSGSGTAAYSSNIGGSIGMGMGMGMDRPLPPRSGPGKYGGHRPKSMDLVTPFSGEDHYYYSRF